MGVKIALLVIAILLSAAEFFISRNDKFKTFDCVVEVIAELGLYLCTIVNVFSYISAGDSLIEGIVTVFSLICLRFLAWFHRKMHEEPLKNENLKEQLTLPSSS